MNLDHVTHQNRKRTYHLHLPENFSDFETYSLVMVLHGGAANAEYAARMSEMRELADKENFIVVYPNGTGIYEHAVLTWNAGICCVYAKEHEIDDVGFLEKLIDKLIAEYPIDKNRVFITGISNGAMMAHRLACEISEKIRAIAPVAGMLNYDEKEPTTSVSVLAIHGTADEHAPYGGGQGP